MILLLAASNYGTSLGFLLTFFLAGLSLTSLLHGFRNLLDLEVQVHPAKPLFVGETAHFKIEINSNDRNPHPMIQIERAGVQQQLTLLATKNQQINLRVPSQQRGYLTVGKITLSTLYPLGLFRCWSTLGSHQRALVYPQPLANPPPLPQQPHSGKQAKPQQIDEEYQGVRDYQRGDSARRIDWKALAKGHGTLVKNYQTPQNESLQLDWNQTQGDTEQRLSQLCAWLLQAERQQRRYSLHLPHSSPLRGQGEQHKQQCLRALALFGIEIKQ